jgi:hypothetical protein
VEVIFECEISTLNGRRVVIKQERAPNYAKRLVDQIVIYEYFEDKIVGIGRVEVY